MWAKVEDSSAGGGRKSIRARWERVCAKRSAFHFILLRLLRSSGQLGAFVRCRHTVGRKDSQNSQLS
ncbi:Protein of unknown function [Gryllus bimaculatus]|nr:Protein of unknown function [Gryllus bimaculatus]